MELFLPDWGLAFWMLVVFLLLCLILGRYAWPSILRSMEARAKRIEDGVSFAAASEKQLAEARQQASQLIAEAQKQQLALLQATDRLKADMIEKAKEEAAEAARQVKENVRLDIAKERQEAQQKMRDEIYKDVFYITEKLLRKSLRGDEQQRELINTMLDEVSQKGKPS